MICPICLEQGTKIEMDRIEGMEPYDECSICGVVINDKKKCPLCGHVEGEGAMT